MAFNQDYRGGKGKGKGNGGYPGAEYGGVGGVGGVGGGPPSAYGSGGYGGGGYPNQGKGGGRGYGGGGYQVGYQSSGGYGQAAEPCPHFLRGACKFGDKCRMAHTLPGAEGSGGPGDEDEDEQLDEIFAAMDSMGVTQEKGTPVYEDEDDGVPPEIYEELSQLSTLDSAMDVTSMAPPSPKMNVAALEFVPGKGFVPTKPSAPPPPPPAPPLPPTAATPSAASAAGTPAAALESGGGPDPSAVRALINQAAYELKVASGGQLDLSFKARKDVLFPHLETAVQAAYPQVEVPFPGFKPFLRMDLRNFVAETLRPWEKDQEWYSPPAVA